MFRYEPEAKPRSRGKRTEKVIAERLNGTHRGVLGGHDVTAGPFAIEVKSRVKFAGASFMEQAVRNTPEGKTPLVVVVHIAGNRYDEDLVMMRLQDWQDWYGALEKGKE